MNFIQKFVVVLFCFLSVTMHAMAPVARPVVPVRANGLALGVAGGVCGVLGLLALRQSYKTFKTFRNLCNATTVCCYDGTTRVFNNLAWPEIQAKLARQNVRVKSFEAGPPRGWPFVRGVGLPTLYAGIGLVGLRVAAILLQLSLAGVAR